MGFCNLHLRSSQVPSRPKFQATPSRPKSQGVPTPMSSQVHRFHRAHNSHLVYKSYLLHKSHPSHPNSLSSDILSSPPSFHSPISGLGLATNAISFPIASYLDMNHYVKQAPSTQVRTAFSHQCTVSWYLFRPLAAIRSIPVGEP